MSDMTKEEIDKSALNFGWSLHDEVKRLRITAGLSLNITKNSHAMMIVREEGSVKPWLAVWTEQTPSGHMVDWHASLLDAPTLYKMGRHD